MQITPPAPGLFLLSRADLWAEDTSPHPKAHLVQILNVRTWYGGVTMPVDWFTTGTDHSTNEKGQPTKVVGLEQKWAISLPALEDLLAFQVEVGHDLILGTENGYRTLLIYDNYVE